MTGAQAADGGSRRFVPPLRAAVDRSAFDHPLFAGIAEFADLLTAADWPRVVDLDARLALPGKRLVEQDTALLADGLHYETRIAEGRIATRAGNWHDLFNALAWACYLPIKRALNTQQCRHIERMAAGQRNRAQAALTQFDETGVVVRVRDPALLAAWDAHDWRALFEPIHWQSGRIGIAAVFGHALMEQALLPGRLLVGKCIVLQGDDDAGCIDAIAQAIDEGRVLLDPLQLRPLPLAGIPGWHTGQTPAFYANDHYFRPLREGRRYPPPLPLP
ncbi:DUF3025 domain-containing protein [Stenotrophomonas lactitubi]|uniref:DUF3025 domain-containing protein n=1 Tax=Stenotrophomonas lactitubi TaxID=2045214 RepID=UPI00224968AB|nr:DUF3025 domain-containing protein [Stenotrophomonas lactitubi]MCX2895882.1 DUF3025 domain-containing protein [Stenotrophomonas lactitubi]